MRIAVFENIEHEKAVRPLVQPTL